MGQKGDLIIRPQTPKDHKQVQNVIREAFWNLIKPGTDDHYILHQIRKSPDFIPELSLVVEREGQIIAHIAYTHSKVVYQSGAVLPIMTFGPLSVLPSRQEKGVGSLLVRQSMKKAKEMGARALIITGQPYYYHRFGFRCTHDFQISFPNGWSPLDMMGLELEEGAFRKEKGTVYFTDSYEQLDEKNLQEFDSHFPKKEKFRTVSQLIFERLISLRWDQEIDFDPKDINNMTRIPSLSQTKEQ